MRRPWVGDDHFIVEDGVEHRVQGLFAVRDKHWHALPDRDLQLRGETLARFEQEHAFA